MLVMLLCILYRIFTKSFLVMSLKAPPPTLLPLSTLADGEST